MHDPPDRIPLPDALRAVEHRRTAVAGSATDPVEAIGAEERNRYITLLLSGTRLDPNEVIAYLEEMAILVTIEARRSGFIPAVLGRLVHALMVGYTVGNNGYGIDQETVNLALRRFILAWGETGGAVRSTGLMTPYTLRLDRLVRELDAALDPDTAE